jgi:hypothetical protein
MKHKQNRSKLNRYTLSGLALLVIILATAGVIVIGRNHTEAASAKKTSVTPNVVSQFTFGGVKGWTQGPKNNTSMAVFYTASDCFVSMQRNTGTLVGDNELEATISTLTTNGYSVTPTATQAATLQTNTGNLQYQLHQYSVTGNGGGGQSYGGQEYAFIPLSSGYLKVEGFCTTPTQLSVTTAALQAYSFDSSRATATK